MKIEVFPSGSGDCLLLTSSDGKRLLADAGLPTAYDDFIAKPLSKLKSIDVAYVSHIDRDHIGGILKMLDHEVKWRVHEHLTKKKKKSKKPTEPRPPAIGQIWHNAFLDDIAETKKMLVDTALATYAGTIAGLSTDGAAGALSPDAAAKAVDVQKLALSVGDAIEVNWRIGSGQLGIPLNPDFNGKFMVARKKPITLGAMTITVLGPTNEHLRELKEKWLDWLEGKETYVETLRKQHQRDVDRMTSSADISAFAHSQALAALEKDVTPPNLASLVLLVEEDGKRVLLTGDAGDESLLDYLKEAKLLDDGVLRVDVLKVPHHGAHNSFSEPFVKKVRATNYIFCGDGEHHNPEPDVVEGYVKAVADDPLPNGANTNFFFNWSRTRTEKFQDLWTEVEALVDGGPSHLRRKSIGSTASSLRLNV